jgi:1-acyl-sn-glycerol-3-phosphate acyltransferase
VAGVVTRRFLVPMSKIENMQHPIIGLMGRLWGVYPVRRGEADRVALASTLELLRQGRPVLIAPEGTRSPALIEAKDGTTFVATRAHATIVPIGLEGTDQFPGTLKRLRRAPVTVQIGRPFRFRTNGRARIPRDELRQMTREMMYQIAHLVPEHRRGAYADPAGLTTATLEFLDL